MDAKLVGVAITAPPADVEGVRIVKLLAPTRGVDIAAKETCAMSPFSGVGVLGKEVGLLAASREVEMMTGEAGPLFPTTGVGMVAKEASPFPAPSDFARSKLSALTLLVPSAGTATTPDKGLVAGV